jgi:hypothetical protein
MIEWKKLTKEIYFLMYLYLSLRTVRDMTAWTRNNYNISSKNILFKIIMYFDDFMGWNKTSSDVKLEYTEIHFLMHLC